ncbi:hypothetical protein [Haloferax gibbonsii]|uniref:hypothetical protein n=1 Tax=Haloferax gibbonsii TaxID=35746 RepID=UPI001874D829|nr:hypothetical protein [Haloferax gibbonsii]
MIDSSVLHTAKAIKRFFKYSNHVRGTKYDWEPKPELSQANGDERDYLRRTAFEPLYQAALEYSSVKSYHNTRMTAEERERIKTYLSQRMSIPKDEVGPREFKQANSWKVPSMIAVTLDTGLRPIEVGRATVHWANLQNNELNIPKEESTKNNAHWNCTLKERTATIIERWLEERQTYISNRFLISSESRRVEGRVRCGRTGKTPVAESRQCVFWDRLVAELESALLNLIR